MNERRILVAENNPEHLTKLQELLALLHYSVEVHESGLSALQRLQEQDAPGMALLSSSLSTVTGLEIGLEIRRRSRRRHLWLMLMSDRPSADEVVMATDAGIDEVLAKPIDLQDLRMRVRTGERIQSLYRELSDSAIAMEFYRTHDPLTGAWRREAILDLIFKETDRVQRSQSPLSIMLLDIDGLSEVNLKYGHNDGDKLLKMFANRLQRQLRSYDMLGRYAADEFIIVVPGCTSADGQIKADRVRMAVAKTPFTLENNDFILTASIGVAGSHGRSPLVVLREAERALSLAKQEGQNTVRFFGELKVQQPASPEIRRRLVERVL